MPLKKWWQRETIRFLFWAKGLYWSGVNSLLGLSLGRISPHTRKNIKKNPETKKVASENRLGWAPRGKDHLETIDVQDQRWKGWLCFPSLLQIWAQLLGVQFLEPVSFGLRLWTSRFLNPMFGRVFYRYIFGSCNLQLFCGWHHPMNFFPLFVHLAKCSNFLSASDGYFGGLG